MYRACHKLALLALCSTHVEPQFAAPTRIVYSLTPKGKNALTRAAKEAWQRHAIQESLLLAKYLRERSQRQHHQSLSVALNGNQSHIPFLPSSLLLSARPGASG